MQNDKDDCGDYYVSREQLETLLDACKKVLAASKLKDGKVVNGFSYPNGQKEPILEDGKFIEDASIARELLSHAGGLFLRWN